MSLTRIMKVWRVIAYLISSSYMISDRKFWVSLRVRIIFSEKSYSQFCRCSDRNIFFFLSFFRNWWFDTRPCERIEMNHQTGMQKRTARCGKADSQWSSWLADYRTVFTTSFTSFFLPTTRLPLNCGCCIHRSLYSELSMRPSAPIKRLNREKGSVPC